MKILQLNTWAGTYIEQIAGVVLKERPDIIHFQEVAGDKVRIGNTVSSCDNLAYWREILPGYREYFVPSWSVVGHPDRQFGNVTYWNPSTTPPLQHQSTVWLHPYTQYPEDIQFTDTVKEEMPRNVLLCDFGTFVSINLHFGWAKNSYQETAERTRQTQILLDTVRFLQKPFVLTGDFNSDSQTEVIQQLSHIAQNICAQYQIPNTLNPRIHYAKHLFPPGMLCDYIFLSSGWNVESLRVIDDVDMSDHFGLVCEVDL